MVKAFNADMLTVTLMEPGSSMAASTHAFQRRSKRSVHVYIYSEGVASCR